MGVRSSHLGSINLDDYEDLKLTVLEQSLFDDSVLETIATKTKYKEQTPTYSPGVDFPGSIFSIPQNQKKKSAVESLDRRWAIQTMEDVTSLADADPEVREFTRWILRQQHVIRQMFEAMRRQTKRVAINKQKTMNALVEKLEFQNMRMSLGTRMAIRMATHAFLRTVKLIKRISKDHYTFYVEEILEMLSVMLEEVPNLGLKNSPVFKCFNGIYDFITSLILCAKTDARAKGLEISAELRNLAVQVLFKMALATGSVGEILFLVESFLINELGGVHENYRIEKSLAYLVDYKPSDKGKAARMFLGKMVQIQTESGKYLCVEPSKKILTLSNIPSEFTVFEIQSSGTVNSTRTSYDTFSIKNPRSSLYITNMNMKGQKEMKMSPTCGPQEKWKIQRSGGAGFGSRPIPGLTDENEEKSPLFTIVNCSTSVSLWATEDDIKVKGVGFGNVQSAQDGGLAFRIEIKEEEALWDDEEEIDIGDKPLTLDSEDALERFGVPLLKKASAVAGGISTASRLSMPADGKLGDEEKAITSSSSSPTPLSNIQEGSLLASSSSSSYEGDSAGGGVAAKTAAVMILASLDRLVGAESIGVGEVGGSDSGLATVSKPLCINVSGNTLKRTLSIISLLSPSFFASGGVSDDDYVPQMYMLIATLRVLKAHIYQLVKSKLPLKYFEVSLLDAAAIKKHIVAFIQDKPKARTGRHRLSALKIEAIVQAEAAQIFAEGFEFFFQAVSDQVTYLADLLTKRLKTTQLSKAELTLLKLLLTRFASFSSGALLMDELEGKGQVADHKKSLAAVQGTLGLLLEVAAAEAVKAIEELRPAKAGKSPVILILANLQKHLLSRAGQWKILSAEEELKAKKMLKAKSSAAGSDSSWRIAFETLLAYTKNLLESSLKVLDRAAARLRDVDDAKQLSALSNAVLHDSMVGQLARPMLSAVSMFVSVKRQWVSAALLPLMAKLTMRLDAILVLADRVPGSKKKVPVTKVRTANSSHPYVPNRRIVDHISVAGATEIRVEFDARCETMSNTDTLQLFAKPGKASPLTPPLFGPAAKKKSGGADAKSPRAPRDSKSSSAAAFTGDADVKEGKDEKDSKLGSLAATTAPNPAVASSSSSSSSSRKPRATRGGPVAPTAASVPPPAAAAAPRAAEVKSPKVDGAVGEGKSGYWPAQIDVSGSSFYLSWTTNGNGGWGFGLTIKASVMEIPTAWVRKMAKTAAWLTGGIAATLIQVGDVEASETRCKSWLQSNLFKGGLKDGCPLLRGIAGPESSLPALHAGLEKLKELKDEAEVKEIVAIGAAGTGRRESIPSADARGLEASAAASSSSPHSSLFGKGLTGELLGQIAAGEGVGGLLVAKLRKICKIPPVMLASVKPTAARLVRSVFALLLYHTGMGHTARKLVEEQEKKEEEEGSEADVPEDIKAVFLKASEMQIEAQQIKGRKGIEGLAQFEKEFMMKLDLAASLSMSTSLSEEDEEEKNSSEVGGGSAGPEMPSDVPPLLLRTSSYNRQRQLTTKLKSAVRALQQMISARTTVEKEAGDEKLMSEVIRFMRIRPNLLGPLKHALLSSRYRATARLLALKHVAELVRELRSHYLIPEMLRHVSLSFRLPTNASSSASKTSKAAAGPQAPVAPSLAKIHFLSQLDVAGESVRGAIEDSYFLIIAALMTKSKLDAASRILLCELCNVECSQRDLIRLTQVGIVPLLRQALVEVLVGLAGRNKHCRDVICANANFAEAFEAFQDGEDAKATTSAAATATGTRTPTGKIIQGEVVRGLGDRTLERRSWNSRAQTWALTRLLTYFVSQYADGGSSSSSSSDEEESKKTGGMRNLHDAVMKMVVSQIEALLELGRISTAKKGAGSSRAPDAKKSSRGGPNDAKIKAILDRFWKEDDEGGTRILHKSPSDDKGIFHFLGTGLGKAAFQNPHDSGRVEVTCSDIARDGNEKASKVVGREAFNYTTRLASKPFVQVDLKAHKVLIHAFRVSFHSAIEDSNVVTWELQGSADGKHFDTIETHDSSELFGASSAAAAPSSGFSFGGARARGGAALAQPSSGFRFGSGSSSSSSSSSALAVSSLRITAATSTSSSGFSFGGAIMPQVAQPLRLTTAAPRRISAPRKAAVKNPAPAELSKLYVLKKPSTIPYSYLRIRAVTLKGTKIEFVLPRLEIFGILDPQKKETVAKAKEKPSDWWQLPEAKLQPKTQWRLAKPNSEYPLSIIIGQFSRERKGTGGGGARSAGGATLTSSASIFATPQPAPPLSFGMSNEIMNDLDAELSAYDDAEFSSEESDCFTDEDDIFEQQQQLAVMPSAAAGGGGLFGGGVQTGTRTVAYNRGGFGVGGSFGSGGGFGNPRRAEQLSAMAGNINYFGMYGVRGSTVYPEGKHRITLRIEMSGAGGKNGGGRRSRGGRRASRNRGASHGGGRSSKGAPITQFCFVGLQDTKVNENLQAGRGPTGGPMPYMNYHSGTSLFQRSSGLLVAQGNACSGANPQRNIGVNMGWFCSGEKLTIEWDTSGSGTMRFYKDGKPVGTPVPLYGSIKNAYLVVECTGSFRITMMTRKKAESSEDVGGSGEIWARRSRTAHLSDASNGWYIDTFRDIGFTGVAAVRDMLPAKGEVDAYLNQFLWVVLRCIKSRPVQQLLSRTNHLQTMLALTEASSSKVQQILAIRIVRSLLPHNIEMGGGGGNDQALVLLDSYFERIGFAVLGHSGILSEFVHNEGDDNKGDKKQQQQGGQHDDIGASSKAKKGSSPDTEISVASELGSLMRSLMRKEGWRPLVNKVLKESGAGLKKVLATLKAAEEAKSRSAACTQDFRTTLAKTLAALYVLMGHCEPLREGARVVAESNGEVVAGTVVCITKMNEGAAAAIMMESKAQGGGQMAPSAPGVPSSNGKGRTSKKKKGGVNAYSIHFDNGDSEVIVDETKLDFVADVDLDRGNIAAEFVELAKPMVAFVEKTAEVVPVKGSDQLAPVTSLLLQLRAYTLKALNFLLKEHEFGNVLLDMKFGTVLNKIALSHTDAFKDFEFPSPYNLETLAVRTGWKFRELEQKREEEKYLWQYYGGELHEGDQSGIIYYIATDGYKAPWKNPCDGKKIAVTFSSMSPDAASASAVVGRSAERCVSQNKPKQSVTVDLQSFRVKPTHYTLRHYSSANQEALRNWDLMGSVDGQAWKVLKSHRNDAKLSQKGQAATWELPKAARKDFYQQFRIQMTGKNSNNTYYLACSGFELFGSVMKNDVRVKRPDRSGVAVVEGGVGGENERKAVARVMSASAYHGESIYCWAQYDDYGLCLTGQNNGLGVRSPKQIDQSLFNDEDIVQIVCPGSRAVALTASGNVYYWGQPFQSGGGWGFGGSGGRINQPKLVESMSEHKVIQVAGNYQILLMLTEEGKLFYLGYMQRVGVPANPNQSEAQDVPGLEEKKIRRIATSSQGQAIVLAHTDTNEVYVWGNVSQAISCLMSDQNSNPVPGFNQYSNKQILTPTLVDALSEHKADWAQFGIGGQTFMALDVNGDLYTTGAMNHGHGSGTPVRELTKLDDFDGHKVVFISAAAYVYYAITDEGRLYAWGQNSDYGCGTGGQVRSNVPTPTPCANLDGERVVRVSGTGSSGLCVTESGNLYRWGYTDNATLMAPTRYEDICSLGYQWSWITVDPSSNGCFLLKSKHDMRVPSSPTPFPFTGARGRAKTHLPWYPDLALLCGTFGSFLDSKTLLPKDYVNEIETLSGGSGGGAAQQEKEKKKKKKKDQDLTNSSNSYSLPLGEPVFSENEAKFLPLGDKAQLSARIRFMAGGKEAGSSDSQDTSWFEDAIAEQAEGQSVFLLPFTMSIRIKPRQQSSIPPAVKAAKGAGKEGFNPFGGSDASTPAADAKQDVAAAAAGGGGGGGGKGAKQSEGPGAASSSLISNNDEKISVVLCRMVLPVAGGEGGANYTVVEVLANPSLSRLHLRLISKSGEKLTMFRHKQTSDAFASNNAQDVKAKDMDIGDGSHSITIVGGVNAEVSGYVDDNLVLQVDTKLPSETLDAEEKGRLEKAVAETVKTHKEEVLLTFASGCNAWVRDAGFWKFAGDEDFVKRVASCGLAFLDKDLTDVESALQKVQTVDFDAQAEAKELTMGIILGGNGGFLPRENSTNNRHDPNIKEQEGAAAGADKSSSAAAAVAAAVPIPHCYRLRENSNLMIPVSVEASSSWTAILDFSVESLPKEKEPLVLFSCSPNDFFDAKVDIPFLQVELRHNGKLHTKTSTRDAKKASAVRKSASVKPKTWYRLILTYDKGANTGKPHVSLGGGFAPALAGSSKLTGTLNGRSALVASIADKVAVPTLDPNTGLPLPAEKKGIKVITLGSSAHTAEYNVAMLQFWPRAFKKEEVSAVENPRAPLLDPLQTSDYTRSLLKMGHPERWCLKAIEASKKSRKGASDWIRLNVDELKRQDEAAEHLKMSQNLSLTGFPVAWCSEALSVVGNDEDAAIAWLLSHYDELTNKQQRKTAEQKRQEAEEQRRAQQMRLRFTAEKKQSGQQTYRILKSTQEQMDIELGTLIQKPKPERAKGFDCLDHESLTRLRFQDQKLHKSMAVLYARQCILSMLSNWPEGGAKPLDFEHFGGFEFVGKFLRLVDFSRIDNGMDVLRTAVSVVLSKEKQKVEAIVTEGDSEVSMQDFSETAPLSLFLVSQGLGQLIKICCGMGEDVEDVTSEEKCLGAWNASMVVWIFDVFIKLVRPNSTAGEQTTKLSAEAAVAPALGKYGKKVLLKQVVNLVFKSIAVLKGRTRLSFVQLLTTLIRLGVDYDRESCDVLKDLLNRIWQQQKRDNKFTQFFQALLELVIILDQQQKEEDFAAKARAAAEEQKAKEQKEKEGADAKRGSSGGSSGGGGGKEGEMDVAEVGGEGEEGSSLRFTECKFKRNLDTNGVLYHIGSRGKKAYWENPGESGEVGISFSSVDEKALVDDFEVFNRDTYVVGLLTDPNDPQPSVTFNFYDRKITPTHYSLRCGADVSMAPRNWRLEASSDGEFWAALRIHSNDKGLAQASSTYTWPIILNPTLRGPFSMFRLVGTGGNAGGKAQLFVSGFEIYGTVSEPSMTRLTFNVFDASEDLKLAQEDLGSDTAWVKSVGGEPVKPLSDKLDSNLFEGKKQQKTPLDPRPTVVCSDKDGVRIVKSVQGFTSGRHYFAFEILAVPSKSRGGFGGKKKPLIVCGLVSDSFSVFSPDPSVGSQEGTWGLSEKGQKIHKGKQVDYASAFKRGDTVGVEVDLDAGTLHFYINDIAQGLAFLDVKRFRACHPAVSLNGKGAKVKMLGEMAKPPSRRPENWPWFDQVLLAGRIMLAFSDRKDFTLPYEFISQLHSKINSMSMGSAERELPQGVDAKQLDPALRIPSSDADAIRAIFAQHLERQRQARLASGRKPADGKREVRTSFLWPMDLEPKNGFYLDLAGMSDMLKPHLNPYVAIYCLREGKGDSEVSRITLGAEAMADEGLTWDSSKAPKTYGTYEFRLITNQQNFGKTKKMYFASSSSNRSHLNQNAGTQTSPTFRVREKVKDALSDGLASVPGGFYHIAYDAKAFSLAADSQLVACVDRICDKKSIDATIKKFPPNDFNPTPHLIHYPDIENCTTTQLQIRLLTLQLLNRSVTNLLPMLDFSVKQGMSRLTDTVRALRTLIFWSTKNKLWMSALQDTQASGHSRMGTVQINRFRSNRLKSQGKCDVRGTRTCFGQLFRKLNKMDVALFRAGKGMRVWKTEFAGEGGIDAGGLYRELIFVMCQELQSPQLPLFILCPNGREQIGQNRHKWVPNPSAVEPLHLSMYEFLGKLMGLAIRTTSLLSLDLPSIVWKPLIGAEIEESDVVAIDRLSFKLIENMQTMEPKTFSFAADSPLGLDLDNKLRVVGIMPGSQAEKNGLKRRMKIIEVAGVKVDSKASLGEQLARCKKAAEKRFSLTVSGRVTPEQFDMAFSQTKFVIVGSDQKERELIPGGKEVTLTWSNRKEFCTKIVDYRKKEFQQQCAAIRRGLACVVPYPLLSIFAWEELEIQVCGRSQMNVDLLQKMTRYQGCTANDTHIQFFWQIMRERFDEMERAKFLKFVWGRARLPVRAADFQTHFTINVLPTAGSPDSYMPIGHTCFFSIDMPKYTNLAMMHKRLLYAITHCEAIDADYGPENIQVADEGDSDDDDDL